MFSLKFCIIFTFIRVNHKKYFVPFVIMNGLKKSFLQLALFDSVNVKWITVSIVSSV